MEKFIFEGFEYHISYATMPTTLKDKFSEENLNLYLTLLEKIQKKPKKTYKEVKDFCAKYHEVPEVLNLLTFAHIRNRRIKMAEALITKTFADHPEYLFAKINYADQCVRKKHLGTIPEIFPTFNLKELCPEKKVFHSSEFRGFLIMMTYYQLALKNREKALHYFSALQKLEPNHPGVIYLEKAV